MTTRKKTTRAPATISDRLKQTMLKRGITSAALAKRANVKTSFLYDVISGKSANPSTLKLVRVADALDVSLTYLAGATPHAGDGAPEAKHYLFIPALTLRDLKEKKATAKKEGEPCYGFHRQWIQKQLEVNPDDLRLWQIRDDGMEPTLRHHDMALVDIGQRLPSPPGIFVLHDGNGLLVKRLEYAAKRTHVRVISDNQRYSIYKRPLEDTFIIGRVVWVSREI